jgi:hypothetical protein
MAKGQHVWRESAPLPWNEEVTRFFTALAAFDTYLASDAPLGWPAERLFQGPIADALTHVGQLTMQRRLAGSPVKGENYAKAEIAAGRVGARAARAARRIRLKRVVPGSDQGQIKVTARLNGLSRPITSI